MKNVFEKIVDRLEELKSEKEIGSHKVMIKEAIEIVNQVAGEYGKDGWIPISSGNLPDENTKVWCINADGETMAGCVRWDEDEQDFTAWGRIGAYNDWMPQVVAWMSIVPYKEGD